MCDTHRKHACTTVSCPTAQRGFIHPHTPNAPPQHASSWRQPWRQLAPALLRGPVHGTRLLSAKGPRHQETQRDRLCPTQRGAHGGQRRGRQTDRPTKPGCQQSRHTTRALSSSSSRGRSSPLHLARLGGGGSSTGWPCHPPCPRAGSRRVLVCLHTRRKHARAPGLLL